MGFFTYSSPQKPYPGLCITFSLTANVLYLQKFLSFQPTLTQLVPFLGCFLDGYCLVVKEQLLRLTVPLWI